jgi:DDE_Tnp_1-associated
MEEFGKEKEDFLRELLPLDNGIPSHDTINRIFMLIDAAQFERCFRAWTAELSHRLGTAFPSGDKELIAIDGKSICNSAGRHQGLGALHLVSAWSPKSTGAGATKGG